MVYHLFSTLLLQIQQRERVASLFRPAQVACELPVLEKEVCGQSEAAVEFCFRTIATDEIM